MNQINRILIRGPDTVGSFVLATPFFRELRKNFVNNYIVLSVKPLVYDLAKFCPYVDKVILYDKNLITNIKRLVYEKFDTAFLLSGSFEAALVCFFSKIKNRIGYPHDHRGFLLTTKIEEIYKKHYVDYILYILEYIGCKIENKQLELYNTFETKKFDYIFENNNPVIGITYTSITNDARRWPVEYVINLAEMLVEKGYKVVILGKSNRHKEINKPFVYDLVNKTTLLEFIFIVKKLEQYISVATGGIHIAAAAGIKTIGIYIPGDEIGWAPYSDKTKILTRYTKCAPCNQHKMKYCKNNLCMQLVKPEDVLDLVRLP